MENQIRIYNGRKQVKKGKIWRSCCLKNGCTNRTSKEFCKTHTIVIKNTDPNWCSEAKAIYPPDIIVKIPKNV